MVTAVTGKIDGAEVVFRRNEAGQWEAAVPASAGGMYVIELWAEDAAGNRAYFATVKVTFDTSQMCMAFEVVDVGAGWSASEVRAVLSATPLSSVQAEETHVQSAAYFDSEVLSKIIRCEVCGR